MSNHTTHLHEKPVCPVCGKKRSASEMIQGRTVRPILVSSIQKIKPDWTEDQTVCLECLNDARTQYVQDSLIREVGHLGAAEQHVIHALKTQELISVNTREQEIKREREASFGERVADKVAAVGGSWTFILGFICILLVWISINSVHLLRQPFDPYPYILLNLVLSCVAAFQAPIIMMSQNRQAAKDRAQAEADYKTNLKAELEIRHLHLKMDQLVSHQWQRLLEIQQIQIDMMNDLKRK